MNPSIEAHWQGLCLDLALSEPKLWKLDNVHFKSNQMILQFHVEAINDADNSCSVE